MPNAFSAALSCPWAGSMSTAFFLEMMLHVADMIMQDATLIMLPKSLFLLLFQLAL